MASEKRIHEMKSEIRAFWERERIFEQTVERDAPNGEFIFYDGPPTANAPPGVHHVESQTFKDIIPRYKTMRGCRVRRKAGWDTHGLSVELQIEKKLGLKTKKDIEAYGVAKFNAACRDSVWEFKGAWEDLKRRMGSWMDMRNPYVTYEMPYVESVWWFLRTAWDKGLLTRDYRSVWYCPRCQTPLSSHEVAQGYEEDVEDPSVTVKFEISNLKFEIPKNTRAYFLTWTTTPWTLPGNVALAVHPEVEYAVVRHGGDHLILAKPLVERVLGPGIEVLQTIRGSDLVGTRYEPLYNTSRLTTHDSRLHSVLPADFVSLDDGTGIVHIATAYGPEDFELGKAHGIPPLFTVHPNGVVMDGYPGVGKFFKAADADVRADLTRRWLLFRDETIRHTYPFCWRCDTPLLAYARASWYIAMSKLRSEIQERNKTIHWLPEHIKDGRFGEWLRELKDWAITRERYWGAPIPIWECDRCQQREIVGSFADLLAKAPRRNRFILMRHGEARSNVEVRINSKQETSDQWPLISEGRARVERAAEQLKGSGITKIIASPFHRMRQTAEIVSKAVGVPITYDERLREFDIPDFDGKTTAEHRAVFPTTLDMFLKKIGSNETWGDLAQRILTTLKSIDEQHEGQTILICSHGDPLFLLRWAYSGRTKEGIEGMPYPNFDNPTEFAFTGSLVNDRGELDVHRPFIDGITWSCTKSGCGGTMQRFPEVVDVWLESGCMPFAQVHYPFEAAGQQGSRAAGGKTPEVEEARRAGKASGVEEPAASPQVSPPALYPADYISEAIDQTRGWFYTLLAVATVLGWDAPYRNVVVLGHLLDKDGQKMSKSKGNVVDPIAMIDRYSADVVRWYMVAVNQPWDAKLFDEEDLKRMSRKPFGTLMNLLSFRQLHGGGAQPRWPEARGKTSGVDRKTPDVELAPTAASGERAGFLLDSWLRARTRQAYDTVTTHLDAYEITEAARAISDLVDDVSTWWLRRSRERLRAGKHRQVSSPEVEEAQRAGKTSGVETPADVELAPTAASGERAAATFTAALQSLAVLLAPFAPYTAEHLFRSLPFPSGRGGGVGGGEEGDVRTIHLAPWDTAAPPTAEGDATLLQQMSEVRRLCSLGLEARAKAGIPVRQPLAALRVPTIFSPSHGEGERGGEGNVLLELIRDELNVKEVIVDPSLKDAVTLDTTLTPELKREGMVRELTRAVNNLRKEMNLTPTDRIRVTYETDNAELAQAIAEYRDHLAQSTTATEWSERGAGGKTSGVDRETPDVEPAPTGASGEPAHHTLTIASAQIALDIAREV